jgi:hypothetical protein
MRADRLLSILLLLKPQMNTDEHRSERDMRFHSLFISVLSVFICVHLWFQSVHLWFQSGKGDYLTHSRAILSGRA